MYARADPPPHVDRGLLGAGHVGEPNVWFDRIAFAFVLAVALAAAAVMLAAYLDQPDLLWRDYLHDRNGHFQFGLDLALAVKAGDPLWFFSELEKAKVWPPLHGLVLSAILLVAGTDHRWAIVPSLIGWIMTIAFSFLIARRLFADRIQSIYAGAVTIFFVMTSPALRLLSSDVMLEGLGAGLSAAALWALLRADADRNDAHKWRLLALILTALFFEKGNYWGLMVASLTLAFVSNDWGEWSKWCRDIVQHLEPAKVVRLAPRDPLLILFAVCAALVVYLYWLGPSSIQLWGRTIRLYPPQNLTTLAYGLAFARSFLLWRHRRGPIDAALGVPGRALFYWHAVPVLVSFLLPQRLSVFLWFVGPANSANRTYNPLDALLMYSDAFVSGFHAAPWAAVIALSLFVIGAIRFARESAARRAVFVFALVSFIAVIIHPQHQGRFLASWIFAVWVGAGAGAAIVLEWIAAKRSAVTQTLVAATTLALAVVILPRQMPSARAYAHAIHPSSGPTDLDLVRPVLSALAGARHVVVAASFPGTGMFGWALREACQCKMRVERSWLTDAGSRDEVRRLMEELVATTPAQYIIVVDARNPAANMPIIGWTYEKFVGVLDAMQNQDRYVMIGTYAVPSHQALLTVWRSRS